MMLKAPASMSSRSNTLTSCILPSEMWMKVGIAPRRSSSVCNFTCRLGRAERGPREHRQAEIDRRGIERIHGIGQFHAEVFADVECAGLDDQPLGKLEVYAPVARLVGVGQCRACDRHPDAHVIELAGLSPRTHLDIAQALPVGQLREGHDTKLLGATKTARAIITAVTI